MGLGLGLGLGLGVEGRFGMEEEAAHREEDRLRDEARLELVVDKALDDRLRVEI